MVMGIFSSLAFPSLTPSPRGSPRGAGSDPHSWQVLGLFSWSPRHAKAFLKSVFSLFPESKGMGLLGKGEWALQNMEIVTTELMKSDPAH